MQIIFTGLPGSGKTYGVVENVVLPALKAARTIVTNIPLRMELVKAHYPLADVRVLDLDDIRFDLEKDRWGEWLPPRKKMEDVFPPGCVAIIDECRRVWPGGVRQTEIPQDHRDWFGEHRHFVGPCGRTTEIVMITQNVGQVSAYVRNLCEKTYKSEKMTKFGITTGYRVDIISGFWGGERPPESRLLGQIFGKFRKNVWQFYTSHTRSNSGVVGQEHESDTRGKVWQKPTIKYGMPVALLFILVGGYKAYGYLSSWGPEPESPAQTSGQLIVADQVRGQALYDRAPVDPQSEEVTFAARNHRQSFDTTVQYSAWRVGGHIETADDGVVMLKRGEDRRQLPLSDCFIGPDGIHDVRCHMSDGVATLWSGSNRNTSAFPLSFGSSPRGSAENP